MRSYEIKHADQTRLDTWGGSKPSDEQAIRVRLLEDETKRLAQVILTLCPMSRERSSSLSRLDEVRMWAQSAVQAEIKE